MIIIIFTEGVVHLNFWEVDELNSKDLLTYGWDIFFRDSVGFRLFIFTILYDQVLDYGVNVFWSEAFGFKAQLSNHFSTKVIPVVGLMGSILAFISYSVIYSFVIHQALIGKTKYTDLIGVLKNSWRKLLLFSLATALIFGFVSACFAMALGYVITNHILFNAFATVVISLTVISLSFTVFSFTIKSMGLLKSCHYSLILTKKYWHKTLWYQLVITVILLISIVKPPYFFLFFMGLLFIYVDIVLLIQFHNIDYIEKRQHGSR